MVKEGEMSYNDDFHTLWLRLTDANAMAFNMDMCGAQVVIPHEWFVKHGLQPMGTQSVHRQAWILSVDDVWKLWMESEPTVRWKEVY